MEVKGGESVRINDRQQQIINLLCQRRSDTVQTLATELGVSRQTIISLENGKYNPYILLAHSIARLFGERIEDIFIFEEEEA